VVFVGDVIILRCTAACTLRIRTKRKRNAK
jgi:hypothetical protein